MIVISILRRQSRRICGMRGNISIYNSDCMKAMAGFADNAFDLAIVDPPYGIGAGKKTHSDLHIKKDWDSKIPDDKYFSELSRVSKNQIIWGCNYFKHHIKDVGRIVWSKLITPIYYKTSSHCELASSSFHNRTVMFTFQWCGNVQAGRMNTKGDNDITKGIEKRYHPTQKPVQLYKWLLQNYAKEGDKILDTHLGSGSIALACWDLCFDLTGYEIDVDYFNAASLRLERHQAQGQLF